MDVSVLEQMDDAQLVDLATKFNVKPDFMTSRDKIVYALRTFPNTDKCHDYVDVVQPEDIVAFRTSSYTVKSAKVIRRSTADKKLMLETSYGRQFVIDFDDVIWVNTNGYWPKWVYKLMKENENAEADNAE